jgi:E3 ubiquitin-protein ligase RBX1
MADVVMTDVSGPAKKAVGKAKAGGSESGTDGKKRFEVKKVRAYRCLPLEDVADVLTH